MLKYYNYEIVFREIPDEVSLYFNLTNCPNHCKDCHSKILWNDIGNILNEDIIDELLSKSQYKSITCFVFGGGDNDTQSIIKLSKYIKSKYHIKVGWYSGLTFEKDYLQDLIGIIDFVKMGKYDSKYGNLEHKTTNQRMFELNDKSKEITDITSKFFKY